MSDSSVVVEVNGVALENVPRVTVAYGATEGVRTASVVFWEPPGQISAPPGSKVRILDEGEPVCSGIVREYPIEALKERRLMTLQIESKTCDLAECGMVHKTGFVRNKKLDEAATELAKGEGEGFAAKIRSEGQLEPIDKVVSVPGETVFSLVERYARSQALYVTDTADGDQLLFKGTRGRHAGVLSQPGNIIGTPRASLSERNRFSETRVRGQNARKTGKPDLRSESVIKDAGVGRYRPQVINHEGDADAKKLKTRAGYDQDRAGGVSASATVIVPGWRDDARKHWQQAYIIPLDAPDELLIQGDMVIANVELRWDVDGEIAKTAQLELRDPRSFAAKGGDRNSGSGGKSNKAWEIPDVEPTLRTDE